jgi:hypothetical protein
MDEEIELPASVLFGAGHRGNIERKQYLERQKLINCGYCRYHRNENRKWHRKQGTQQKKRIAWKENRRMNERQEGAMKLI